jgi:hypothetical protein
VDSVVEVVAVRNNIVPFWLSTHCALLGGVVLDASIMATGNQLTTISFNGFLYKFLKQLLIVTLFYNKYNNKT